MKRLMSTVALTAVLAGCGTGSELSSMEQSRLKIAENIEEQYEKEFGCGVVDVTFIVDDGIYDRFDAPEDAELVAMTVAPGDVRITSDFINTSSSQDYFHTVAHEVTHACGTEVTYQDPFKLNDSWYMYSSAGFTMDLTRPISNDKEYFTWLEEGTAGLLADKLVGEAETDTTLSKQAITELTNFLVVGAGITTVELAEMHNEGDLLGLVARLFGLEDRQEVQDIHLQRIIDTYNQVYEEGFDRLEA